MANRKTIGSLLLEYSLITQEALDEALSIQKKTGRKLGEVLIDLGRITHQDIEWILSKQFDIPFVIIDEASLDRDLISRFQKEFLLKNRILPLHETDDAVAIATDDPFQTEAFEAIEQQTGKKINLNAGSGEKIEEALRKIFKSEGLPELISIIDAITARLRETSFYRLDFISREFGFQINAFGFGLMRNMLSSSDQYKRDDVFRAFNSMGMAFLYSEFVAEKEWMLSVYPLIGGMESHETPMILGRFGLCLPKDAAFTDVQGHGLPALFHSPEPVPGYEYYAIADGDRDYENTFYTVDLAPVGFQDFFVSIYMPHTCEACDTAGCNQCGELGYTFEMVEGVYSYNDLINRFNEG